MDETRGDRELLDELADAFTQKLRRGERPDVTEITREHPDLADEIERLFGVIELMEGTVPPRPESIRFPGLEVVAELAPGVGGMGKVFKARELNLDRMVAVKTLREGLPAAAARTWFEREAKAAAALDHPNIVRILSFTPDHDPPFFVMQLVEGQRLDEACRGRTPRQVAALFEKVAHALAFAHGQGIVHRDIKPANVLVDSRGEPLIADFGLARRAPTDGTGASIDVSSFAGTPTFVAPEVFEDPTVSGPSADVYALGVTLYTILCGRKPFDGPTLEALRSSVLEARPVLPREIRPAIPEALQRICLAAMEADPRDRCESAAALADELARFVAGREVLSRPRRFQAELRGRLEHHVADVRGWQESSLIDRREADLLIRPYERLLGQEAPWREFVRRFPLETVMLRIGGTLVVLSSALWPAFYWPRLDSGERVAATAIPTVLLGVLGWTEHLRRRRSNALVLLLAGAVLLPLALTVLLTEYDVLARNQPASQELFGEAARSHSAVPSGGAFAPSNFQLLLATGTFWTYGLFLLLLVRARTFVSLTGVGAYATCSAAFLCLGLKEWLFAERVADVLALYVPLSLAFALVAGALRTRARERWSAALYRFFPVPFVVLLTLLAYFGAAEWLEAGPPGKLTFDDEAVQLWLMANAAVYALVGFLGARSEASWARHWSAFFLALIPVSVLVPANVLFTRGESLFTLGAAEFTIYELVTGLAAPLIVAIGTRLNRVSLIAPGMLGVAVLILRITHRHFLEHLAWPLSVGVLGALAMFGGAALAGWRLARR